MNPTVQTILAFISPVGAVLIATVGALWGRQMLDAKNAEIAARDAQLQALKSLTAPELLPQFEALKALYQLASDELRTQLRQAEETKELTVVRIADLESQIQENERQSNDQISLLESLQVERRTLAIRLKELQWRQQNLLSVGTELTILDNARIPESPGEHETDAVLPQRLTDLEQQLRSIESLTRADDLRLYENAIGLMAIRARRPVRHLEMSLTYLIDDGTGVDSVFESYRTAAATPDLPLLWQSIDLASTNDAPAIQTFRDLEGVAAYEVHANGTQLSLQLLPASTRAGRAGALVFFDPPIGTQPRDWRLTYNWPGLWNPLRARYRDTAILRLQDELGVQYHSVTVTFVFPANALNPVVRNGPSAPSFPQPHISTGNDGRYRFTFTMHEPGNADYDWLLEVEGFDHPRQ